ncbi:MAG: hypothetical protein DRJ61_01780 [Acidobacteria bacterium]|nr:MAG: hypothetical protein DRJ61_01780 [Acidobacteriota bacterium]
MISLFSLAVVATLIAPAPLTAHISPEHQSLDVRLELNVPLPDVFMDALPSGGVVRVIYPLRVRSKRSFWWDGRIWKGELTSQVSFDPITGRYRCKLLLDEIVVDSKEVDTMNNAVTWLRAPPSVQLVLRDDFKKLDRLYLRARAVFSTSTTWLVFPDREGTDWVTVPVIQDPVAAKEPGKAPHADSG